MSAAGGTALWTEGLQGMFDMSFLLLSALRQILQLMVGIWRLFEGVLSLFGFFMLLLFLLFRLI